MVLTLKGFGLPIGRVQKNHQLGQIVAELMREEIKLEEALGLGSG